MSPIEPIFFMALTFSELDDLWSAYTGSGYPAVATTLVITAEDSITTYCFGSFNQRSNAGVCSGLLYKVHSNRWIGQQPFGVDLNAPGLGWDVDYYEVKAGAGVNEIELRIRAVNPPVTSFNNRPIKLSLQKEAKLYFGWAAMTPPSDISKIDRSRPALIFSVNYASFQ